MAETSPDGGLSAATRIEFVQYHQPPLQDGDYQITLTQTVTISGQQQPAFSVTRQFSVQGPRCALDPVDVHAVFPPVGSLGEHSNVLPHVVLTRSTLPWERPGSPDPQPGGAAGQEAPWLALLLFDDAEKPAPAIVTLGTLRDATGAAPWWPGLPEETGEDPAARVTVIDVAKSQLQDLLPGAAELASLAHVRRGTDSGDRLVGDELAVIIGNRLPAAGASSTVHLVSLERRYRNGQFDFQGAGEADSVRLISLKSWSFACVDARHSFSQLLLNLDPYTDGKPTSGPATLRLPGTGDAAADQYLAMGFVALPHTLREGSTAVSWYHGPLIPWDNAGSVPLPARAADELVRFYPANGMFDVSYAAAWELGRLLTLQSRQVSTSLYAWKRACAQQLRQAEQHVLHLPFARRGHDREESDLWKTVVTWFDHLNLLQGVPFNYLVPDERLLPAESIRFFWLDPPWVDCLLDGAFSIGRVITADHLHDRRFTDSPARRGYDKITGCLLRSDVVSGWPGLQVDGYDGDRPLRRLRMERLSPHVLICLFAGEVSRVSVHQKPETLHFGLDRPDGQHADFFKKLRDPDSNYQETDALTVDPVPWRRQDRRILDVASLAAAIAGEVSAGAFTSAQFALQMIEGVEAVSFEKAL